MSLPVFVPEQLTFFIPCIPPMVSAQQKGAFAHPGGGVRFFKNKRAVVAEKTWQALFLPHRPTTPMAGPLFLTLLLHYPWRKSEKKSVIAQWKQFPHCTRPDYDNISKSAVDVLGALGFFHDDGQLSRVIISKSYSDEPGVGVTLVQIEGIKRPPAQPQTRTL